MINEFERVKIKKSGITGIVVDIYKVGNETFYTVESDEKGVPGGYGTDDSWKLFRCTGDELERTD